jgi:hypothetical protein
VRRDLRKSGGGSVVYFVQFARVGRWGEGRLWRKRSRETNSSRPRDWRYSPYSLLGPRPGGSRTAATRVPPPPRIERQMTGPRIARKSCWCSQKTIEYQTSRSAGVVSRKILEKRDPEAVDEDAWRSSRRGQYRVGSRIYFALTGSAVTDFSPQAVIDPCFCVGTHDNRPPIFPSPPPSAAGWGKKLTGAILPGVNAGPIIAFGEEGS